MITVRKRKKNSIDIKIADKRFGEIIQFSVHAIRGFSV